MDKWKQELVDDWGKKINPTAVDKLVAEELENREKEVPREAVIYALCRTLDAVIDEFLDDPEGKIWMRDGWNEYSKWIGEALKESA